ncbi:MAG: ABC transporter substrate-binding protein [Oscillospiraceae bacterium]|nr:ABC transporter substrate-binding protein [Oscillospiraceae bacterium]
MGKRLKLFCKYILTAVLTLSILSFMGCGKSDSDGSGHVFIYDLAANPRTLDPQTATLDYERMVISNLFDGLVRVDSDGNIAPAIARTYEISDDLLTYTFYLKEDVSWADKDDFSAPCTAHDFVFAFRRLFNPEVRSRNIGNYLSIVNARAVNSGELPLESLGVTAANDFTLVIRLEQPDDDFLRLLTAPPAFPCNEEFYILSAGRYGLLSRNGESYVPSNSGFFLREWIYDQWWTDENRIILRRREGYEPLSDSERIQPRGINFYIDRESHLTNFTSGDSDCIIISGESAAVLVSRGYTHTTAENSVWGFIFSESGVWGNETLRFALAHSANADLDLSVSEKSSTHTRTSLLIPNGIKVGDVFYRDLAGIPDVFSSSEESEGYATAAQLLNSPVLLIPEGDETVDSFTRTIVQQWQEELSLFCKIEVVPPGQYAARLESGDYDIAVVKITAAYNSPSAIFDAISGYTISSHAGEHQPIPPEEDGETDESDETGEIIEEEVKEVMPDFPERESRLLKSGGFIPICFMTEYFFYNSKCADLTYNPFTNAIDFREGKRF